MTTDNPADCALTSCGCSASQEEGGVMSMTLDHSQAPVPGDFAIRDLAVLAYAQGFTLWHYRADAGRLNLAAEAGFFDAAVDLVACGDIVMVSSPAGARLLVITRAEDGVTTASLL